MGNLVAERRVCYNTLKKAMVLWFLIFCLLMPNAFVSSFLNSSDHRGEAQESLFNIQHPFINLGLIHFDYHFHDITV